MSQNSNDPTVAAEELRLTLLDRVKGDTELYNMVYDLGGDHTILVLEVTLIGDRVANLVPSSLETLYRVRDIVARYDESRSRQLAS